MSFVSHLQCTGCGAHYPADQLMNLCPVDNRPVEMILDLERLKSERTGLDWYQPQHGNMWRFGSLLPLDTTEEADKAFITSLGEGHTPLLDYSDNKIAKAAGFTLQIKDEGRPHAGYGANPTGSFKDRGMATTLSMARKFGLEKLAIPTQGNAGDSLCEYANAAGLSAVVAMPDNTPQPIMARVAELAETTDRFHLELVNGTIREAGELLKRDWIPQGWFSVATFQEPGWRIEGKKTMGLELAEPAAPDGPWKLPDVVIYPTGGGTGVLGMWKAWDELQTLGLIDTHRPRVVCVQNEATAPLVEAMHSGAADTTPAAGGETLAYGMNVPGGVGHFKVLEIMRASGGAAIAVSEADMLRTFSEIWRNKGWSVCPEGAACLAAIPALLDSGMICQGDSVVVFNTGSMEKYLPELQHLL